jgi:predicted PurR-regulated permease PerM
VLALAAVVMVGWLLHVGRPILAPIAAAVLIVFVIRGVADLLAKQPRLARLPGWARELLAAALIGVALVELLALVTSSIGEFAGRAAAYQDALLSIYQGVALRFDFDEAETLRAIRAEAARALDLPGLARAAAGSAAGALAVTMFVLLNVGFLLAERRSFAAKLGRLGLGADAEQRVGAVLADVNARVGAYLAMKTLMNLILGVLSWSIMLAFGVEFATLFAIVIAALNYIPYFGSFIGVAFPAIASLVTFADPGDVVLLVLCLAGAQFLIGNVIEPQAMGSSLNLSPWVILIALTVWGALWGIAGAVLSVPITAVMLVILSEFEATRPVAVLLSKDGTLDLSRGARTTAR